MSEKDLLEKFDILDKLAKKSDRWWFFALLVVGMMLVGFILRWEQNELNKRGFRIATLEERQLSQFTQMNAQLIALHAGQSARMTESTKVVEANSRPLEAMLRKP